MDPGNERASAGEVLSFFVRAAVLPVPVFMGFSYKIPALPCKLGSAGNIHFSAGSVPMVLRTCSLIFSKVSALRSCSTLQASAEAVSSLTPR